MPEGFGWNAPSEEELSSGNGEYPVLAEDEYIARVTEISIAKDQPNKFPSANDNEPTHDMLVVKAEALTFADSEPLVDIEGKSLDSPIKFQVWLNPKKRGMLPQPSKTRKFFAAVLGQPLGDTIAIGNFESLVGKTLIVSLKPSASGYNNAQDFRAVKRNRSRGTTSKGPVDGESLIERAKEIFDEDSPTNTSPNPAAKTKVDEDIGNLDF